MLASQYFRKFFTKKHLREIYFSSVRYKVAVGIDNVNREIFEKNLDENIDIINRKTKKGTYKFTPYREKLVLRGPQKPPRVVSIPTIRDKLTLKALYEVLLKTYQSETPFVHQIINEICISLADCEYDCILRLDVKNFYPSIDHAFLFKKIHKRIRKNELLKILSNALQQPTVAKIIKDELSKNEVGIPQGLSISNILANIYFSEIDDKYSRNSSLKYFRYVDDILILCNCEDLDSIKAEIEADCKKINLDLHEVDQEKSLKCNINDGFSYLGYVFENGKITVREKSIEHLRMSLLKLFTHFKYSDKRNLNMLKWSIDLRITGCIFNETKYGWLFFFSQINDLQLLKALDHFIQKMIIRFDIDTSKIKFKKFTRAYHEITKNLSYTEYIPNFDELSVSQKSKILSHVFDFKWNALSANQVEYYFNKRIYQTIRDLEKDLARAS